MLPLYNHTPLIRIYSKKCRIDLNILPDRENEFNLADNFSHPEFVDEMWVEDVNPIDEHILDYQEDTANGSLLQAEVIEDFSDNPAEADPDFDEDFSDSLADTDPDFEEDLPDSPAETDPDFDDGLTETSPETDDSDDDYSVSSDLSQELDHDNSVDNDYNQDNDKGTKEPLNLLMLEPTLYWYYPYLRLGNQKYQHNHYLR